MREPLNWLLQCDGLTPFGDCLTKGQPIPDLYQFDKLTSAILQNLWQKVPSDNNQQETLNYKSLLKGIKMAWMNNQLPVRMTPWDLQHPWQTCQGTKRKKQHWQHHHHKILILWCKEEMFSTSSLISCHLPWNMPIHYNDGIQFGCFLWRKNLEVWILTIYNS